MLYRKLGEFLCFRNSFGGGDLWTETVVPDKEAKAIAPPKKPAPKPDYSGLWTETVDEPKKKAPKPVSTSAVGTSFNPAGGMWTETVDEPKKCCKCKYVFQ